MLRLILTSSLLLLFTACVHDTIVVDTPSKAPKSLNNHTIAKIAIPVREHGYNNFKTQVIKTQTELDHFVEEVKQQEGWNKKENFLETLLLKKIDFSYYNLLLYRITESSGSTILSVDAPSGNAKNITIVIGRDEPSMGSSDMAYYALAYKVAKSVSNITFDNGLKKSVIENSEQQKPERDLSHHDSEQSLPHFPQTSNE